MFNNQSLMLQKRLNSGKDRICNSDKHPHTLKRLLFSKSEKDLGKMFKQTRKIEEIMENNSKSKSIKDTIERNKDYFKKSNLAKNFK